MTENRSGYATNCLHLSTCTDKLKQVRQEEAERIHNLPRDELVYQVDGETDSQQELIERLAEMVIEARDQVAVGSRLLAECHDRTWDHRAWAKTWKAKAKHDRREWMVDTGQRPWWLRKEAADD